MHRPPCASALCPALPFLCDSPGGGCHDAPPVSRAGVATAFQIVGHAEVVAHLMGHGGSHANGILRVVLLRERVQVRKTARQLDRNLGS